MKLLLVVSLLVVASLYGSCDAQTAYAHCDMAPNSVVEDRDGQDVYGSVDLRQPAGRMTEIRVALSGFNTSDAEIQHGFHIHELGDLEGGCGDTGGHYNPLGVGHGASTNSPYTRHMGDLGNIAESADGSINVTLNDYMVMLTGYYSVVGRAMVVHALTDDLGLGGNDDSLSTGNAGDRIACCVISITDDSHW